MEIHGKSPCSLFLLCSKNMVSLLSGVCNLQALRMLRRLQDLIEDVGWPIETSGFLGYQLHYDDNGLNMGLSCSNNYGLCYLYPLVN